MKVLAIPIRQEKEIKGIQTGKEQETLSLFADDMMTYIENPTDPTKKLLNLISAFGKMVKYKVNIQKWNMFWYTNSKISEREIRGKISHLLYLGKYLGVNLGP